MAERMISEQMKPAGNPAEGSDYSCRGRREATRSGLVRARGIEPRFQAWEAHVIAVILRPRLADVPSRRGARAVKRAAVAAVEVRYPANEGTSRTGETTGKRELQSVAKKMGNAWNRP